MNQPREESFFPLMLCMKILVYDLTDHQRLFFFFFCFVLLMHLMCLLLGYIKYKDHEMTCCALNLNVEQEFCVLQCYTGYVYYCKYYDLYRE